MALLPLGAEASCYQSAQTQAELTRCARNAASEAQKRLTQLLGELRDALEPERFKSVEEVQAAWTSYARAHCRWHGGFYEGGSMQPMAVADCMATLTERRIAELRGYRCGKPSPPGDC